MKKEIKRIIQTGREAIQNQERKREEIIDDHIKADIMLSELAEYQSELFEELI